MNPLDLLSDAPFPPGERRSILLQYRMLFQYLADNFYYAELEDGTRVAGSDATSTPIWLKQLSRAALDLGVREISVNGKL